jgi:hypothetical protein
MYWGLGTGRRGDGATCLRRSAASVCGLKHLKLLVYASLSYWGLGSGRRGDGATGLRRSASFRVDQGAENARYSVFLLYWYDSTHSDAAAQAPLSTLPSSTGLRRSVRASRYSVYLLYW